MTLPGCYWRPRFWVSTESQWPFNVRIIVHLNCCSMTWRFHSIYLRIFTQQGRPNQDGTVWWNDQSRLTVLVLFLRVLPSFTGFYWVLLGFIRFYWVSLGFTRSYLVLLRFTGFYWVTLGFTGSYLVLLGFTNFTGFYLVLLGFTGFHWVLLGLT